MKTPDIRVLAAMVFCCLGALSTGCSGSSEPSRSDAAADSARDTVSADVAKPADTKPNPSPDAVADTTKLDTSPRTDVLTPDTAIDSNRGDVPQTDAPQSDAPQIDAPGTDGAPASDAAGDVLVDR